MTKKKGNKPSGKQTSPPVGTTCEATGIKKIIREEFRSIEEEVRSYVFYGPLPPPNVLGQYDQISKGFAGQIVDMAKSEMKHRHEMDRLGIEADIEIGLRRSKDEAMEIRLGQIFAFIITIVLALTGAYVILHGGHPAAGSAISATGIGGIITAFILGRSKSKEPVSAPDEKSLVKSEKESEHSKE